jgi:hypothetical protein
MLDARTGGRQLPLTYYNEEEGGRSARGWEEEEEGRVEDV